MNKASKIDCIFNIIYRRYPHFCATNRNGKVVSVILQKKLQLGQELQSSAHELLPMFCYVQFSPYPFNISLRFCLSFLCFLHPLFGLLQFSLGFFHQVLPWSKDHPDSFSATSPYQLCNILQSKR